MLKGYPGAGLPEIVNRVEAKDITMAQVALACVLSKDGVSAPIVGGTTNLDNLKDILGGIQVKLAPEEIQRLEEAQSHNKPLSTCFSRSSKTYTRSPGPWLLLLGGTGNRINCLQRVRSSASILIL
ncbi:hypothetical protein BDY19DRAFT_649181 [Irpex rosettiformis]|uniref:Uncharacterized protein n=1 Tax=Irpex rosettiformis TaxID=378272 RepID=A0ACB8TNM5_9APHY|nr:hypothetical protein BDY19DRAFT_649181 [Irpex rosettiformis]